MTIHDFKLRLFELKRYDKYQPTLEIIIFYLLPEEGK